MTFVKIDDAFIDHPKFLAAGPVAGFLALAAIAWSGRNLRDGIIPNAQVPRLVNLEGVVIDALPGMAIDDERDFVSAFELAAKLVEVGLWKPHPDGFQIHDYLDHQPSREDVLEARRKERERWAQRRGNGAAA